MAASDPDPADAPAGQLVFSLAPGAAAAFFNVSSAGVISVAASLAGRWVAGVNTTYTLTLIVGDGAGGLALVPVQGAGRGAAGSVCYECGIAHLAPGLPIGGFSPHWYDPRTHYMPTSSVEVRRRGVGWSAGTHGVSDTPQVRVPAGLDRLGESQGRGCGTAWQVSGRLNRLGDSL